MDKGSSGAPSEHDVVPPRDNSRASYERQEREGETAFEVNTYLKQMS